MKRYSVVFRETVKADLQSIFGYVLDQSKSRIQRSPISSASGTDVQKSAMRPSVALLALISAQE